MLWTAHLSRVYFHLSGWNHRLEPHCKPDECCLTENSQIQYVGFFFSVQLTKWQKKRSISLGKNKTKNKKLTARGSVALFPYRSIKINEQTQMRYLPNQYESQLHRRRGYYYTEEQTRPITERDSTPPSAIAAVKNTLHFSRQNYNDQTFQSVGRLRLWWLPGAVFSNHIVTYAPFGHNGIVRHHQQPRKAAQNSHTSAASHGSSTGDEGLTCLMCVCVCVLVTHQTHSSLINCSGPSQVI